MTKFFVCLTLVISSILAGCADDNVLSRICRHYCWYDGKNIKTATSPDSYPFDFPCTPGKTVCDEDFMPVDCIGGVKPMTEICNNIDDDCDGYTDDDLFLQHEKSLGYPSSYPCLVHGECKESYAVCAHGEWECHYSGEVELDSKGGVVSNETWCDGLDNDCDARVDENIFAGEFCFDVPNKDWWKATNGECKVGVKMCSYGKQTCIGQVMPTEETCNGLDDNCNGIVDDMSEEDPKQYDIIFNVDTSGSMWPLIDAVICALESFSKQFKGNSNYRFALVINTFLIHTELGYVWVVNDFTNFETIRSKWLTLSTNGSFSESQLDAMMLASDKTSNLLQLSYRSSAETIIFSYTDERPQSYMEPKTTWEDVVNVSTQHSVQHYIWANDYFAWDEIATASGGFKFSLNNCDGMVEDANSINTMLCSE